MTTLAEFEQRFATEGACRAYLARLRWPSGFCCPQCTTNGSWTTTRRLLMCRQCGYQASVTAGTIFHRTRLPLQDWFRAMWWMTDQKKHRLSALGLQRLLGLGSYRTAWLWLQKLRRTVVLPDWDKLGGQVEVDEIHMESVEAGKGRRNLENKTLVAIAAQIDGKGIGRIRLRRIPAASPHQLVAFAKHVIEPGSMVITDGWKTYAGLKQEGFKHRPRLINASGKAAPILLPRVHRVASLLTRWLMSTHQGTLSREQLDTYLDEFTFRFNRRTSRDRWKLFYRLVAQAVTVEPLPCSRLAASTS
ncbi:MAG TPA: IS1595 family transposase [Nitrospiraceae bacterium]|nr:IS1595 family transposase [Nitrospiraceae bacterium]